MATSKTQLLALVSNLKHRGCSSFRINSTQNEVCLSFQRSEKDSAYRPLSYVRKREKLPALIEKYDRWLQEHLSLLKESK